MTDSPRPTRLSRRTLLGYIAAAGGVGLLAACSGGSQSAPTAAPAAKPTEAPAKPAAAAPTTAPAAPTTAPTAPAAAGAAPTTAPAAAGAAAATGADVAAAKKEGKLLVYSIMSKANWQPVLDEFTKRYAEIDVETVDLGSYEVFERYYSESAGNARTADLIITSAPDAWQDFIKKGELQVYKSPEDDKLPALAKPAPGIYAASTDPMVLMWNKKLVSNPPKSMQELADLTTKDSSLNGGKITTYEETNATGFAGNWFWAKKVGEDKAFQILTTIGKTKPKAVSSAGLMVDSGISGETPIGYFVSLINILPKFPAAQDLLGWAPIADGTPLIVRGMGITKKAQSPNAAKLMMDFILSPDGQIAFSNGGLTAYRDDVADRAKIHLSTLIKQLGGADKLAPFTFDPDLADATKREAFRAKLKTALGR